MIITDLLQPKKSRIEDVDPARQDSGSSAADQEGRAVIYNNLLRESFNAYEAYSVLDEDPPVVMREPQFYYLFLIKAASAATLALIELKLYDWRKCFFLIFVSMALIIKGSGMYDFFEFLILSELRSRRIERKRAEHLKRLIRECLLRGGFSDETCQY